MPALQGFLYPPVGTNELRQELYLTSVGRQTYRPREPYPRSGHPAGFDFKWSEGRSLSDFGIVLIESGRGVFETRRTSTPCRDGAIFFLPPGAWHRYHPAPETGWVEVWLCANGEFLHRLRAKHRLFSMPCCVQCSSTSALRKSLHALYRAATRAKRRNGIGLAGMALQALGQAMEAAENQNPAEALPQSVGDNLVDTAREFIWFNSHRRITIEFIAAELRVSRRTLERRFITACGHTVVHELIGRRVHLASQLLVETSLSVKEVAESVGFGDVRRLIEHFASRLNVSPTNYRNKLRANQ